LIDIVPTICGMLGIDVPDHIQGKDLSGYFQEMKRPAPDRAFFCESLSPTKYNANYLFGIITRHWKYIHTTRPELYDLVEDPGEADNLINMQQETAKLLRNRLRVILESSSQNRKPSTAIRFEQEDKSRLESLGYIASTRVREDLDFDQQREDPKDLIGFHRQYMNAVMLAAKKDYKNAKKECLRMLNQRPRHFGTYELLAKISLEQNEPAEAFKYWDKVLRLEPDDSDPFHIRPNFAGIHNNLGLILMRQGHTKEAAGHFSEAVRLDPDFSMGHFNLGVVLQAQGKIDEAINCFSKALKIKPDYTEACYNLAVLLYGKGHTDEAIAYFNTVLQLNPDYTEAHNNLGSALLDQGKIDEAIKCFFTALQIDPDFEKAHNNLGVAFLKKGKIEQSIFHFGEALRIKPDYQNAYNNLKAAKSELKAGQ